MSTELAINNGFNDDQIALLSRTICKGANRDEMALFVAQCKRTGLDPFTRQIYGIKYKDKLVIQVAIDGFRLIAQRSGAYAGQVGPWWCGQDGIWKDAWINDEAPVAAKVGVLRANFKEPLFAVARFKSYAKDNLWRTMPEVMIAKCAEALALRKAFPNELSGIYIHEEMDQSRDNVDDPEMDYDRRLWDRMRSLKTPADCVIALAKLRQSTIEPWKMERSEDAIKARQAELCQPTENVPWEAAEPAQDAAPAPTEVTQDEATVLAFDQLEEAIREARGEGEFAGMRAWIRQQPVTDTIKTELRRRCDQAEKLFKASGQKELI